ncbi:FadR family transcriptional regulator [Trinickia symbiotica]|uniref:FadR family transcriptional regulator n=1 Tax=Trinickia symbiotica TaxID=863227 RepID=A0A2T3XKJ5_9BURK|nr:FadR/GntR family transcriptional regulator [Trinickia symbiotica]PTB17053.1 FadR family transcriptional regulator [Trinickia symbiotica]
MVTNQKAAALPEQESGSTGGPVFRRVRTQRSFEAICDQIRQRLARGELKPGDRLPTERELAEQLGVSRSVVREAIRSLESAGIVEARPGLYGGFFIRTGSSSTGLSQTVQDMVSLGQLSIADVTEARIELMSVAIRLACTRATEEELDNIAADIDYHTELLREGGRPRNVKSVIEFYRLIALATHNEVIVLLVDALSEVIRKLIVRIAPEPSLDITQVRRKVLTLMRKRDADGACKAMALHLRRVSEYLESESKKHLGGKNLAA